MITSVIFDLGNVLVDWSVTTFLVRNGYSLEESEALANGALSLEWHGVSDLGVSIAENARLRAAAFPEHRDAIALYSTRWQETIIGPIDGSVALLEALAKQPIALNAITNFPADHYPAFAGRFDFMLLFQSVLVSGEVGMKKPDPRIFALALDRFGCAPEQTLFIDDRADNCAAAKALGLEAHHFVDAEGLEADLRSRGLI